MFPGSITPLYGHIYQSVDKFEDHLRKELTTWDAQWGPLYHVINNPPVAYWVQNIWLEPFILHFDSISQAAVTLKNIQRNWVPVLWNHFRRGNLIQEQLPSISTKPRTFPWKIPDTQMGAWTLIDEHTLIGSARCTSSFPGGILQLEENKIDPPGRAYLKLQEAFIRLQKWPEPGEVCLELGASPGGWTWVLIQLGAKVIAVDRSPLDERLMHNPLVSFIKHDAFTLKPEEVGHVDWVLCDVICYPPRLYQWIEQALASELAKHYVCTIKMQGEADYESTRRFAAIPNSEVVHLNYNKHELTWLKV